jgi:YegS/Rv2252/BmrU family lipid kinase
VAGEGAARAAAARAEGFEAVVAVGGDGTVNEVLNGLDGTGIPVGIVPTGTANVLARDLGIPFDPAAAARVVAGGRPRVLDIGEARNGEGATRRFLCCAGAGFDAVVVKAVAEARKARLGFRGWVRPMWRACAHYDFPALRVSVDGKPAPPATIAVVCNTANYGGLFSLVPGADPGDGTLDACLIDAHSRRSFFRYTWAAWRGTLPGHGDVRTLRGAAVRIESDRAVPLQVDGDPFGGTPLTATLLPGAARVLVPDREGS